MKIDFDKWYKQKIEEQTEAPPRFVWNNIQKRIAFDLLFKNRLFDEEINPPLTVWSAITNRLDFDQTLKDKLDTEQETPPPTVWNAITNRLDFDQTLKDKLDTEQETPPPTVWEGITNRLDFDQKLKDKLDTEQETPPPTVWEGITNRLDFDQTLKDKLDTEQEIPPPTVWEGITNRLDFDQTLKDKLDTEQETPPSIVWEGITSRLDFDQALKGKLEAHREEPPEFVWRDIESQMDVASVWKNIDKKLDKKQHDKVVYFRTKWAAVAAAILLFVGLNLDTHNGHVFTRTDGVLAAVPAKNTTFSLVASVSNSSTPTQALLSRTIKPTPVKLTDQIAAVLYANGATVEQTGETTERSEVKTILSPEMAYKIFTNTPGNGMQYLTPMSEFEREDSYYKLPLIKRISFGVIGSYNNTWILSRQKVDQVADADASSSMSGLGKNIGLIAAIDYSKCLTFQTEFVHSETSQNYNKFFSDKFSPQELLVNYLNFNLLAVYKRNHFFKDFPASHNFISGVGFGYLTAAKLTDGEARIDVKEKYARENILVTLGYEYEIQASKRWSLATGIRGSYGLSNIERIPDSQFNDQRSNTLNWGGHIMLKYHLGYK